MKKTSTNGKEDTKTLENVLEHHFKNKHELDEIERSLDKSNNNIFLVLELHEVKFTHAMHNRNWNHRFYPFLGFYRQRGDSFKDGDTCRCMMDEEHLAYYGDAAISDCCVIF